MKTAIIERSEIRSDESVGKKRKGKIKSKKNKKIKNIQFFKRKNMEGA